MFLLGYGRAEFWRLVGAGVLFGGAVVGTHTLLMRSINVGGTVTFNVPVVLVSVALAIGVATALLSFMVGARGLRPAFGAAAGTGLAICAAHYVGEAAIEVHLSADAPAGATGLGWLPVALVTLVLGTALIAMMWFFTVGTATRRDLHAIFDPLDDSGQIDPWMIEQVTARIALTTTGEIPVVHDDESLATPTLRSTYVPGSAPVAGAFAGPLPGRRKLGPRPTPGITPVWRTMPVWGHPEKTPEPEQSRAWALRNAVAARLKDRSDIMDLGGNSRHLDLPAPLSTPGVQAAPALEATDVGIGPRREASGASAGLRPEFVPAGQAVDGTPEHRPPDYGGPLPRRNSRR
jgi:hypothetical protein